MTDSSINPYTLFSEQFPHHEPLPSHLYKIQVYIDQPYRLYKILLLLSSACNNKNFRELPDKERISIVTEIERSCFNNSINKVKKDNKPCYWQSEIFRSNYDVCCAEIANNINENSLVGSSYLIEKIISNEIPPSKVGFMNSVDMHNKNTDLLEIKKKRLESKIDNKKYTTLYTCGKCHGKKIEVQAKQTRSGDEGKSFFMSCGDCGFRWKS